mmetsp:Transcript_20146/g.46500  ORF Transcript_20146/g.46500 Transcript_20146/m.46500 type:complete len:195 (-) Transcript_20146:294-878(-)|eukprot:CAMPEP_0119355330 /NCGR_PEP_ID=MMETSP1334-20130426/4174_1 /TAXON_ID=127549 /ORGANISM="Calcidiscus leptoporus, Strain RCC1130" /LENGTH=194 /DNA_ID=CAMNT_0007369123 /DNA_START=57 /DNA_END=641 /DNA_ORIENTATION=-
MSGDGDTSASLDPSSTALCSTDEHLPYVPPPPPSEEDLRVAEARKMIMRVLDTKLTQQDAPSALQALRLALKLASNILDHPDEPKFNKFKASNPAISSKLFRVPGGPELVREMGFRPLVIQFEEWFQADVSPFGMRVLGEARDGLSHYEQRIAAELAARESERRMRLAGESKERMQILKQIQDDKEGRRDKQWR